MEFPTPTGIEARKLEIEEILELHSNNLWKPVFATKKASQKNLRKPAQLVRATPREEGSASPNAKQAKRLIVKLYIILNHKRVGHISMVPCATDLILDDPNAKLYCDITLTNKIKQLVSAQYYLPSGSEHHNFLFKYHEVLIPLVSTKPSSK
eukprot:12514697-Ditylum_brightwellii.AAC.2